MTTNFTQTDQNRSKIAEKLQFSIEKYQFPENNFEGGRIGGPLKKVIMRKFLIEKLEIKVKPPVWSEIWFLSFSKIFMAFWAFRSNDFFALFMHKLCEKEEKVFCWKILKADF